MTDTQSRAQDSASASGPRSVDAEARFLKSLIAVYKDNRAVLPRLPELMEQCLNKEPLNPELAESRPREENRKSVETELKKKDKLLEESEKTAKCLEDECLKLQKELEKKEKETSEAGKAQEEKCLKLQRELENKEKELLEKGKVTEERITAVKNESENKVKEISDKVQHLENQCLKLQKELENKEKELLEKGKVAEERVDFPGERDEKWRKEQWEAKEKHLKSKHDDSIFQIRKHHEQQLKKSTEVLQKNNMELQILLNESTDIASRKGKENEALKEKLRECEWQLQEKINSSPKYSRESYEEELRKIKQAQEEKRRELDKIKERHAAFSERKVRSDQRRTENTLSTNRQSQLESEYVIEFKDGKRVDAIDIITTRLSRHRGSKISSVEYLKCCRLACFIFEIAYEVVLVVKESFAAFTCAVMELLVDDAPAIGSDNKAFQNKFWKLKNSPPKETSHTTTQDALSEVMILVKEREKTYDLNSLVQHVKSSIATQWNRSYRDQLLLDYDSTLLHGLNDYIKYCTQFAWCAVTQVPPLKIDFKTAAYSSRSHTVSQDFSSTEEKSPTRRPAQSEARPVLCYLWPTLQDCDGKVLRKGEVILDY